MPIELILIVFIPTLVVALIVTCAYFDPIMEVSYKLFISLWSVLLGLSLWICCSLPSGEIIELKSIEVNGSDILLFSYDNKRFYINLNEQLKSDIEPNTLIKVSMYPNQLVNGIYYSNFSPKVIGVKND